MLYRPPAPKKMWDCTLFYDNESALYHIYYLSSGNIGHVTTKDFTAFSELEDIAGFGPSGSWNERGLFLTGCIVQDKNTYKMLLGTIEPENLRQVYGLYTSRDLIHWTQYENNPVLFADGELYDNTYSPRDGGMYTAWRDPQVYEFRDGWYYLCLCARLKKHADDSTGAAIANVRTRDFINYEYLPPLSEVGTMVKYAECPDCFTIGENRYLTFLDHAWGGGAINTRSVKGAAGTFYQIQRKGETSFKTPADFLLLGNANNRQCGWAARTAFSSDGQRIIYYHVTSENSSFGIPKLIKKTSSGCLKLCFFPEIQRLTGDPLPYDFSQNIIGDNGIWRESSAHSIEGEAKVFGSAKPLCKADSFIFECALTIKSGRQAGISLWQADDNKAVCVYFDCDTNTVRCENLFYTPYEGFGYSAPDIVNGGEIRESDCKRFPVKCGKTYHLKLFAKDKTIDFYLDGVWIFCKRFNGSSEYGTLSLFVNQAYAEFKNIKIFGFK